MLARSISIVIPVYNSELSLPLLFSRLDGILGTLAEDYEVILVNDGSRDRSGEVLDALAAHHSWACAIHLTRNYGQHNALLCGIRQARNEIIVTMDDDLQNPPEEIPGLLEVLAQGYDVVYGYPKQESHGFLRDLASRITKLGLQQAMGVDVASRISSFRVFRTEVREAFAAYQGDFVSIDVLLGWSTTRFAAKPVSNPSRTIGASNYSVYRLIVHAMNMVTGFTTLPLQLASLLGFVFALFGLVLLVYVAGRYLIVGGSLPGFPFLACALSIFAGVQLFALGIIGEYIARMHIRSMDKPSYMIRKVTTPK